MTLAGAGFVPCEVPCPARVLTAYPCVVRRDPTVRGTFPSEAIRKRCPLGGSEKRGGLYAHALFLLFPHRGPTDPFAGERARTCDVGGAADTAHGPRPFAFGRVAAFALSPAAGYLTGLTIPIDGGMLRTL